MTPMKYLVLNICVIVALVLAIIFQHLLRYTKKDSPPSSRTKKVGMMEPEKVTMMEPEKVTMMEPEEVTTMEPKKVMQLEKVTMMEPENVDTPELDQVRQMEHEKMLEKKRTMELEQLRKPETRLTEDAPSKFSFLPSLKRSCSSLRDLKPMEILPDPYREDPSCRNILPGLAHLEHGYNMFGSQSFKNRKRDKVFSFSCYHDSSLIKYEYNGSRCDVQASSCLYQKPEEVVDWTDFPQQEQSPTPKKPFVSDADFANLLEHFVGEKGASVKENTLIYELEEDQLEFLKNANVTEWMWMTRKTQSMKLTGHIPTRSLIQEYRRLDPEMKTEQSYMDYHKFISRFGTHVLDNQVSLGGALFAVNLATHPGEHVVIAEGGEPYPLNLDEWSGTLRRNPVPLTDSFNYIKVSNFIQRNFPGDSSPSKMNNFEEIMELEKMHQMLRNAGIALGILNIESSFQEYLRTEVKRDLHHLCPSDELLQLLNRMHAPGRIQCTDSPYWGLEQDGMIRYLAKTLRFSLVKGVCTTPRRGLGDCANPEIVFPPLTNCVRFYKKYDCSGDPSMIIRTTFKQVELEIAMLTFRSFSPC